MELTTRLASGLYYRAFEMSVNLLLNRLITSKARAPFVISTAQRFVATGAPSDKLARP